jgi:2-iminobutanoate/2-iminopropanoate deaminase
MKKIIYAPKAPKAAGPYSQAVEAAGLVFISGQIPVIPITGEIAAGGFDKEVRQVMKNIENILNARGLNFSDIVHVRVYMRDIKKFDKFNQIYGEYFPNDPPARAVIEISGLPKNAEIEIEAIASVS